MTVALWKGPFRSPSQVYLYQRWWNTANYVNYSSISFHPFALFIIFSRELADYHTCIRHFKIEELSTKFVFQVLKPGNSSHINQRYQQLGLILLSRLPTCLWCGQKTSRSSFKKRSFQRWIKKSCSPLFLFVQITRRRKSAFTLIKDMSYHYFLTKLVVFLVFFLLLLQNKTWSTNLLFSLSFFFFLLVWLFVASLFACLLACLLVYALDL